jgi:hypothetical protein
MGIVLSGTSCLIFDINTSYIFLLFNFDIFPKSREGEEI